MLECYLVRHTKPNIASGICYGRLDLDVDERFIHDAQTITEFLQIQGCQKIITSPAKRCVRLAQHMAANSGVSVVPDAAWLEFNFGDWEGLSWEQIGQNKIEAWQNDLLHFTMPNGDNLKKFDYRVVQAWQQLVTQHQDTRLVLVTHAGVIRSILANLLACPVSQSIKIKLDYGSITKVMIDGDFQQLCYTNRGLN